MKSGALKNYEKICRTTHVKFTTLAERHQLSILLLVGVAVLAAGLTDIANAQTGGTNQTAPVTKIEIDDGPLHKAACALLVFMQGSFGALIMVAAGIGAIMAAAVGKYSAALSLLVVGCGAFILESLCSVFFPSLDCQNAAWRPNVKQYTGAK